MNKIAIIVPTYNNFLTIKKITDDILERGYFLIIVDDGSKTPLKKILPRHQNLIVLRHDSNLGKGAAIITGAKKAKQLGYDGFITLDGDGQHLASEIKKLIEIYEKETIVIGARNFNISNIPKSSKFGRWFSNFWASWDTNTTINDSLSGFRLYPISILDLNLTSKGFDWEMEVLIKHANENKKILETDIKCFYPKKEDRVSHFRKFHDTMAIIMVHIKSLPFKWFKKILNKN